MNEARIKTELSRIVGKEGVQRLTEADIALSSSFVGCERALEVAPANSKQSGQIMEFATQENMAILLAGAGTWLEAGDGISHADIVLSTRRMNRVISHEPADLVATVEAGATLVEFQNQLAQAGQWLPIDPPDDGRATIGGAVATGLGGAHSFGFGLPRSFVIGMRVTMADGRSINAGGKVVKNVAGYDLCKLFTGSYGTLGLINEVTFKLRPLPAETRTVSAVGSFPSLIKKGGELARDFFPVAVELLSHRIARHLDIKCPPDSSVLLVRFAGSDRAVVSQTAKALKLLREDVGNQSMTVDDDGALWRRFAANQVKFGGDLSWRVSLKPTELATFLDDIRVLESDEASFKSLEWHAGLGDGRLRATARTPAYHREAVRALSKLRERAESLEGRLFLENAPAEIKAEFDPWGDPGSVKELMKRVKAQLDPQNLLSPGRVFSVNGSAS
jgi:FAD/FMN-containing dehydrogenase